jgi:hypothetical protein
MTPVVPALCSVRAVAVADVIVLIVGVVIVGLVWNTPAPVPVLDAIDVAVTVP